MFRKIMCLLGLHYDRAIWSYETPGSCEYTKRCQDCKEVLDSHTAYHVGWTGWKYIKEGSCEQEQFCRRCGEKSTLTPSARRHIYGDFHAHESDPCKLVRNCTRCGFPDTKDNHDWGEWDNGYPYKHRTCKNCPKRDASYVGETTADDYDDNAKGWTAHITGH